MKTVIILILAAVLAGCAVTGEPVRYQAGRDPVQLNARVDGTALTATVLADGQPIIVHSWQPFQNARDERSTTWRGHDVRSVLRVIKGFGSTNVQVYVTIDGAPAGQFFF